MLMQKISANNALKMSESEDVNSNSSHSTNVNLFVGKKSSSLAGSECNGDKSNEGCSLSEDDSHELGGHGERDVNRTSFVDRSSSGGDFKLWKNKKEKKKTVKVKITGTQDDKAGIKLKIRRTKSVNQDDNHVIVDATGRQKKRHLKGKHNKLDVNGYKCQSQLEEVSNTFTSDDSLPQKRSRLESEEEEEEEEEATISKVSVGINTLTKATDIEESILGPCQAGSKLNLESVVLMETQSGILIVSVQWRGKTLMGALMESERFQIGSLEKDSLYRRDKCSGINRRNTRRKCKNLFGKKKRKPVTPPDSNDVGGTENEAGNSDMDNPYVCDKEKCCMKFSDFQALRMHIYQNHRMKNKTPMNVEANIKSDMSAITKSESHLIGNVYIPPESLFPVLKHLRTANDCSKLSDIAKPESMSLVPKNRISPLLPPSIPEVISTCQPSEERNTFSPAYSDISDANEAPVLENEAELKPLSCATQPPLNLSLCHNSTMHVANRLFSPTAPALQPEGLCSASPLSNLRLSHDAKLAHLTANYRYPLSAKFDPEPNPFSNGCYMHNIPNSYSKSHNGLLSLHSGLPISEHNSQNPSNVSSVQDLSINNNQSNLSNNTAKLTSNSQTNHKIPSNFSSKSMAIAHPTLRHPHTSHHQTMHSYHSITNGFTPSNHNSNHSAMTTTTTNTTSTSSTNPLSLTNHHHPHHYHQHHHHHHQNLSSESATFNHTPSNGVLPHLPFVSFANSVNSSSPKPSEFLCVSTNSLSL